MPSKSQYVLLEDIKAAIEVALRAHDLPVDVEPILDYFRSAGRMDAVRRSLDIENEDGERRWAELITEALRST